MKFSRIQAFDFRSLTLRPASKVGKSFVMLFLIFVSFIIRLSLLPEDGTLPYTVFYPAIGLTAFFSGLIYGLSSVAISGLLAYWFFLMPVNQVKGLTNEQLVSLATYCSTSILMCLFIARIFNRTDIQSFKPKTFFAKTSLMLSTVVFAFLIRIAIIPISSNIPYLTFFPAVVVVTFICGFEFGLSAVAFSGFLAYYVFLPPASEFKMLNHDQAIGLMTFLVGSSVMCFAFREIIVRGSKIQSKNIALQEIMTTNSIGASLEELVQVISSTIDMRDRYTAGHQRRVAQLAVAIGKKLDLSESDLMGIKLGGLIHDLGKMSTPLEILTKPGKLSPAEIELIREHPKNAYEALKEVKSPWPLADIVLQHHERFDGSGYPQHLVGDNILLEARILAVADVVEAMSAMRPYREGLGMEQAMSELKNNSGVKYDPTVVQACVDVLESGNFVWNKPDNKSINEI